MTAWGWRCVSSSAVSLLCLVIDAGSAVWRTTMAPSWKNKINPWWLDETRCLENHTTAVGQQPWIYPFIYLPLVRNLEFFYLFIFPKFLHWSTLWVTLCINLWFYGLLTNKVLTLDKMSLKLFFFLHLSVPEKLQFLEVSEQQWQENCWIYYYYLKCCFFLFISSL